MADALAYLITFTCYGTRLHGNPKGSVDSDHRMYNTPTIVPSRPLEAAMEHNMGHAAVTLNQAERATVLQATIEICKNLNWNLLAAHIRTNHVHLVIAADSGPEWIMTRLKAHATKRLNEVFGARPRRWTRHGSTRYLRNENSAAAAIEYVVNGQGKPMAHYHVQLTQPDPEPRTK